MSDLPLVSVVVPVLNGGERLHKCVESLSKITYPNSEILVVDNGSTDDCLEPIKQDFAAVRIVENGRNLLLAEARNIGIRNSQGKYVFLVDYDNLVAPDSVSELVSAIKQDARIGIAGTIAYYASHPNVILTAGSKINLLTSRATQSMFGKKDIGQLVNIEPRQAVTNAFMVRRETVQRIGLFDSNAFPIGYDEPDFCERARFRGYATVVVPTAKVYHDSIYPRTGTPRYFRGAPTTGRSAPSTASPKAYYHARNRTIYMARYAPTLNFVVFLTVFVPAFFFYYLLGLLANRKWGLAKAHSKGTLDGIVYVFRKGKRHSLLFGGGQ